MGYEIAAPHQWGKMARVELTPPLGITRLLGRNRPTASFDILGLSLTIARTFRPGSSQTAQVDWSRLLSHLGNLIYLIYFAKIPNRFGRLCRLNHLYRWKAFDA